MIPKKIHYCWFGENEKSKDVYMYINTWKENNPSYEIIEWNEKNFDISSNRYMYEAYKSKKWAFVSDVVRLSVLNEYGGIYLDTDVECIKPFDDLLGNRAFIGLESNYSVCTAVIGAEKGSEFIGDALSLYENLSFVIDDKLNLVPNSQRLFDMLKKKKIKMDFCEVTKDEYCSIYPHAFFSPINCYTRKETRSDNTITIHRYASSWKSKNGRLKDYFLSKITRIIGEDNRQTVKSIIKKKG